MPNLRHEPAIDRSKAIFHRAARSAKDGREGAQGRRGSHHRRTSRKATLSPNDVNRAATLLFQKLGESAIAGAMLHAHEAELRGAFIEMANWRRIAESALHRLDA
jgi:hypothetical protein